MILLIQRPELQRAHLRQHVVDVVEGAGVDVALPLPTLALAVEGDLAGLQPGHIHPQQFLPDLVPLLVVKLRILVDDMLEMVHHGAVGDEGQGAHQVAVPEFPGIVPEEALRPGPCEEFHGHGVDFAAFQAGPNGRGRDPLPVGKAGESVAGLVGHHFHVVGSAVEVGEDEGNLVVQNAGAVAAAGLAGLALHHRADSGGNLRAGRLAEAVAGVHVQLMDEQIFLWEGRRHSKAAGVHPCQKERYH